MVSQQQKSIDGPEEETPPPLDQKHTSAPTSSWRGWSLWLRVLGVVLALVGNVAFAFLATPLLFVLLVILVGVESAGLIRSWWSLLIVPVLFNLGFSLSQSFTYGFGQFVPNVLSYFTLLFMVLVELGVLIGTPIGKRIEQRLQD